MKLEAKSSEEGIRPQLKTKLTVAKAALSCVDAIFEADASRRFSPPALHPTLSRRWHIYKLVNGQILYS